MLGYFLFTEKSALIFTKQWVGLQFGCFLRKLIWSPWLYPNVWATSFNSKSCALISTKNGSATVWAIFSQTHPVTLACIPKIPIFVLLWKALESELWFMSWPFGLFCDNLVPTYILILVCGTTKSGNPGAGYSSTGKRPVSHHFDAVCFVTQVTNCMCLLFHSLLARPFILQNGRFRGKYLEPRLNISRKDHLPK
jgi:hypothetical protein